ncbi:hypothetical protein E5F05_01810 (plasmid) [Deinococcus metallilatus]|uniref:Uncharacterized protein n=1 Tax=Deinococcus metallilatus TaxID=1211322 RepID=A0ABR6MYE9_9DEIO|nr:hypothetical protein [Deinococcus metallilatus]MBB5296916.1 hypothetical protein [Deinococcus metallilatus]QBY06712.1 hypothetical protein E5F05_01810 [Deinococcus metallilatus]
MTIGLTQSQALKVSLLAVSEIEKIGVSVTSTTIENYFKFENAKMISLALSFEDQLAETLSLYLDSLSEEWKDTSRSKPNLHRVLDLRGRDPLYLGAIWLSFDLLPD